MPVLSLRSPVKYSVSVAERPSPTGMVVVTRIDFFETLSGSRSASARTRGPGKAEVGRPQAARAATHHPVKAARAAGAFQAGPPLPPRPRRALGFLERLDAMNS